MRGTCTCVRLRPERLRIHRDELIELLKAEGVATSVHFIPLHLHSYYRDRFGYRPEEFPVASAAADTHSLLAVIHANGGRRRAVRGHDPAENLACTSTLIRAPAVRGWRRTTAPRP